MPHSRTVPARMIRSGVRACGFVTFFAQAKKVEDELLG